MPRMFGRFTTTIHRSPEFRALTLAQQGAYFLLGLQPEVTAAGVLSLTLRRWADMAAQCDPEQFHAAIHVLQACGHVVVDEQTEELILVKFIKWDDGWKNSKRLPVVMDAVRMISSVHIRDIAVDELRRLAASDTASDDGKRARDALSRELESFTDTASRFDRLGVTSGDQIPEPRTGNQEPHPVTPGGEPSASLDAPFDDPDYCDKHMPDGPGRPCGECGDVRRNKQRRANETVERIAATKRAVAAAVAACTRCNDEGFIEGPNSELLGKCSHSDLALVSVSGLPQTGIGATG